MDASRQSWFDAVDAPSRADLNTCIHCGLCLSACPTYRTLKIEPDSPRGRIYLMRGLSEGRIAVDDAVVTHLDQCLGCRACETACPAGVPYGRLLEATRAQLTRQRPTGGWLGNAGRWVLERVLPDRGRTHFAADLLRLGQAGPVRAFMASDAARRLVPAFARQGYALTPPIAPRAARGLEAVATSLPTGASLEMGPDAIVLRPAGRATLRIGFFTTCVMEAMFPRVNQEAARLLVLAGCEVVSPRAQTCCGALQAHAGLRDSARRLARINVGAFAGDLDYVVTDSAGCGAALREAAHLLDGEPDATAFSRRVRDVSEVLAEAGLPPATRSLAGTDGAPLRIAYHDPCHLAHAQKVRHPPRALLAALPGATLVELPNADWCCGSAGTYNLTHPELADAQLEDKLDAIASVDPDIVVVSNPGCLLHMQRGAAARGLRARLLHLVEVLALAHPAPGATGEHR